MKRIAVIAALAAPALLRADWIIDQDANYYKMRFTIGQSALKRSIIENNRVTKDLIVDFAAGAVFQIDHEAKTVARATLDEYLKHNTRGEKYEPAGGSNNQAGLSCANYRYSYNNGTVGGWGGGTGCYTTAIKVAPQYQKVFERWLQASENTSAYLGLSIWYQSYHDGPPRVVLQTASAMQKPVAASEFKAPAAYKTAAYRWDQ